MRPKTFMTYAQPSFAIVTIPEIAVSGTLAWLDEIEVIRTTARQVLEDLAEV